MVRRDGAEVRKERIQEIGKLILSKLHNHSEISVSKTIAALQYEFGLTRDKLMEYLNILAELERFTLDKEKDKIRRVSDSVEA